MVWIRRWAPPVLYVLTVVALFEGMARFALSVDAFRSRVLGNDGSSFRLAWIQRGHVPGLAYSIDTFHPTRGWALTPFLHERDAFGSKLLTTNSQGIRGAGDSDDEIPHRYRILVFGDSFTFGEEVADDETYSAALGRAVPDAQVLNLGVHGYGHDQMLLYLQEAGRRYRPDLVVLGFLPYDMERNLLGFRDFAKPYFVLRGGRLQLEGTPVPRADEVLAREPYRSKFLDLLGILVDRGLWISGAKERSMKGITVALLDAFRESARSVGAQCLFAYLPVWHDLDPPSNTAVGGERFFLEYCQQRSANCVDLRPPFLARERTGVRYKTSGHWDAPEHQLAGELLAAEANRLLARGRP